MKRRVLLVAAMPRYDWGRLKSGDNRANCAKLDTHDPARSALRSYFDTLSVPGWISAAGIMPLLGRGHDID